MSGGRGPGEVAFFFAIGPARPDVVVTGVGPREITGVTGVVPPGEKPAAPPVPVYLR